ncbi:hypothetical protein [Nocardia sp. NRRL S-836]|uniref:hypothetical protein n=1 Tax=Nocardia sp. NRRL S-836 TaxID=1519492 RepID=UPI0006AE0202|nr:hypothetical protein [Nocardia sp. NRRL S-836]KOV88874.1 hypothetical protein ADL03_04185 [Nocardia sp. NRRL S-836]
MGDVLKDLGRAKPPTPAVDHERMERDLAQILTLPRPQPPGARRDQATFRRLAPALAAVGVVALLLLTLLPSDRSQSPAGPGEWWHVQVASSALTVVGTTADPYVLELRTDTAYWLADRRKVVVRANGHMGWRSEADLTRWLAAGSPAQVPEVGTARAVRVGPVRASARESTDGPFGPVHVQWPFTERDRLPSDPAELRAVLRSADGGSPYVHARLAMAMTAAPLRLDQRRAALSLLRTLDGVRDNGVGLAVAAPPAGQFTHLETQLVVDQETAQAISVRTVLTAAEHGLPAGAVVESEDYSLVGTTHDAPQVPADVLVNGEPDTPFIMVR